MIKNPTVVLDTNIILVSISSNSDIKAYANHSANLIEDWKECEEK